MIYQHDGSVVFKLEEQVPTEIMFYTRDPKNPRRFLPNFIPCKYREIHKAIKPCGALSVCFFCQAKKQVVNVPTCDECLIEPKT